jgi:predicted GH43/DUF377 family glycosyl hydrolase
VSPTGLFIRHPDNPVLTADVWPLPVNAVFNPGACVVDGRTVLVCRVEDTRGISHLWVARSDDGETGWEIDASPLLTPDPDVEEERWGFEDARVVYADELDRWVLTCTAYGPPGPAVFLATTDFVTVERHGLVMPPEDKNAALLPRRIGDDWVLLHRPVTVRSGPKAEIWESRSKDLLSWRAPERVMLTREGAWWDSVRIGIGPPPIETDDGWLLIYHGVRSTIAGAIYRVGLALLDLEQPSRVIHRSPDWVLAPSTSYERVGDVPNVVFPCGAVVRDRTLRLYYGAADSSIALATADLDEVLGYIRTCPPDGRPANS